MPLRRTRNSKRRSRRQSGSGFTFGFNAPIAGHPSVDAYSDCGSVEVPKPMDHSVGNVVQGCAQAAQNQPAANAVQAALNSGTQTGGKRKKRKSNKNKKQKKSKGKKYKSKKSKSKSKSKKSKKSKK